MEETSMTLEIAERLIKLRKQHGLSQEELADQLGVSRQAVSKWERAESSPDTDNLIALAKLYNISLDELFGINKDDDKEVKSQESDEGKKQTYCKIDKNGLFVKTPKESVEIDFKALGIDIAKYTKREKTKFKVDLFPKNHNKNSKIVAILEIILVFCALIAYLLVGFLANGWHWAWILFFVPYIVTSTYKAIYKKKVSEFNISFLAAYFYFQFCFFIPNLWGILWVVFLSIPIFYVISGAIDSHISKKVLEFKEGAIDIDIDEDDDD